MNIYQKRIVKVIKRTGINTGVLSYRKIRIALRAHAKCLTKTEGSCYITEK